MRRTVFLPRSQRGRETWGATAPNSERKVQSHMVKLKQYMTDESGASAAEYALILALIAAVIAGALTTLGKNISSTLNSVASNIAVAS